ncbi:MAG: methyltransferase domain-containing protein [Steroidobacter sp.]
MSIPLVRTPPSSETRSPEQLWEQYVLEKELAAILLNAPKAERGRLYSWAYEELFRRIPHHPQLRHKASPEEQVRRVEQQMRFLSSWLQPQTVFLEIGAGDCALSFAVAEKVAHVYAIDVSESITSAVTRPGNFTLMLSDGTSIPTPQGQVTLAYSNQLMEHLHPEDALQQLTNIYHALAPGGVYVCVTPNRLSGPCDISAYFDNVATGFHLKEYTATELIAIFRAADFRTVRQWLRRPGGYIAVPNLFSIATERALERVHPTMRRRLLTSRALRALRHVRLVATK